VGALVIGSTVVADAESILRRGNRGEPATLDPHLTISTALEDNINTDLFEGLTTLGADGKLLPGVAESWTVSEDGKVYRFTLRANALWSDGKPVTADDFVFSFRRAVDPLTATPIPKYFNFIQNGPEILGGSKPIDQLGVAAIDPRTIEITLSEPWAPFVTATSHFSMVALPKHVVEEHGDQWALPENIVSNGAFMLKEWKPKEYIRVVKNPNFHAADSVSLDGVDYLPISDTSTDFNMFKAGELDLTVSVPDNQLTWIKENIPGKLRVDSMFGGQYIVVNVEKLTDPRIRQALLLAADTTTLIEKVLRNETVPAKSFTPNTLPDYRPATFELGDAPMEERIAAARKLMEEAGYNESNRLPLVLNIKDRPSWKTAAVGLSGMWQQIYVDLSQNVADSATQEAALRSGDFVLQMSGDAEPSGDPVLYAMRFTTGDAMNYFRYASPEVDNLLKAALVEVDVTKRNAMMAEAEAIILKDAPIIPLFEFNWKNLVQDWVGNWENSNYIDHRSRWLSLSRE